MSYILFEDDKFIYRVLSKDTLEGGLNVMRNSFFIDEMVSVAVELYKYPNARKELEELCVRAADDGVSVVAIDKKSGVVVGASFNKIQIKGQPGDDTYFEKFAAKCKEPSAKSLVMFMKEADESYDFFKQCNADCLLELMFLATLKEYRGQGIAKNLCEASINLGRILLSGLNVKHNLNGNEIPLEPRPKAVTALFTSFISQKIGKSLEFVKGMEINYNRWSFDGKTYAERIGSKTPYVTLEYKCL